MNRPFIQVYECYSVSMLPGNERHDVEKGGKIIMPPSALDQVIWWSSQEGHEIVIKI